MHSLEGNQIGPFPMTANIHLPIKEGGEHLRIKKLPKVKEVIMEIAPTAPTLQNMFPLATNVVDSIKGYDMDTATERLEKLYELGIQLVKREVENQAGSREIVSPIVIKLNEINWQLIQHNYALHATLCKTYRVFIELTWYQCWQEKETLVWDETKFKTIECAEKSVGNLSEGFIHIKFEYKCAHAVAKLLARSKHWLDYLEKFLPLIVTAGTAVSTGTVSPNVGIKCFSNFKELAKIVANEKPDLWFLNVHYLKWLSACVVNEGDFTLIQKEYIHFKRKGNEYTLCLATIFLDLIKSLGTTEGIKCLAVQHLIDLLGTETQKSFFNHVLDQVPSLKSYEFISECFFPYQKTRILILENLDEMLEVADEIFDEGQTVDLSEKILLEKYKDYYVFPIMDALLKTALKEDVTEKEGATAGVSKLKQEYYNNSRIVDYYETEILPATRSTEESLTQEQIQSLQKAIKKSKELQDALISLILQNKNK